MRRILLALLLSLAPGAKASEPFALQSENCVLQVNDSETGESRARSTIRIERKEGVVHFVEDRRRADVGPMLFRLTIDPASLLPTSWEATFGGNGEQTVVHLSMLEDHLEVRVRKGDQEPEVRKVKKPKEPFVVAPLLRYYLAHRMESGVADGKFVNIGVGPDGAVKMTEVEVTDGGEVEIEVPAGTFRCRRLLVGPASLFLAAVVPAGEMYLAVEGTHPLVKATTRASRFSSSMVTELTSYTRDSQAPLR